MRYDGLEEMRGVGSGCVKDREEYEWKPKRHDVIEYQLLADHMGDTTISDHDWDRICAAATGKKYDSAEYPPRACAVCGCTFTPITKTGLTCSRKCLYRHHYLKRKAKQKEAV